MSANSKTKAKKLILLELNEFLYKIYEELIILNKNLKIISLLANTQDQIKLKILKNLKLIQFIMLLHTNMFHWLKKTYVKEFKIMYLVL